MASHRQNLAFSDLNQFISLRSISQSVFDDTVSLLFYKTKESAILRFFSLPNVTGEVPLYHNISSYIEGATRFFSYLSESNYSKAVYDELLNFILGLRASDITELHLMAFTIMLSAVIDPTIPLYQHRILLPLSHKLAFAAPETIEKLGEYFKYSLSIHERRTILQGAHHYISMVVYTAEANSPDGVIYFERSECATIKNIAKTIMQALYYTRSPFDEQHELSIQDFYSEAINKHINIVGQFVGLMNGKETIVWDTPFLVNVVNKARCIDIEARAIRELESLRTFGNSPHILIKVRRDHAYEDLVNSISHYMQLLRYENRIFLKELKVKFEGESGVDEGGLRQELFTIAFNKLFDPEFGMFTKNENDRYFWFRRAKLETPYSYQLIGLLLGLAIFNNILIDIPLPYVMFKKLMKKDIYIDDIKDLFPSNYKGLSDIAKMTAEEIDTLCLDFSLIEENFGASKIVDLIPNGRNIDLTFENRDRYIRAMLEYLVGSGVADKFDALYDGFRIATQSITSINKLDARELQQLCSSTQELDFKALKANTRYENCHENSHKVIKWFWEIIDELDNVQQRQFLMFVTGSDRAPVGGLGEMIFIIQLLNIGDEYLPTSHACFNILDLPKYSSKEITRVRLLKAIQYCEGFGIM